MQEIYDENQTAAENTEQREVRHTISAEETFTLAKDVYDLRCLIKTVYTNRAQIGRRLNLLSYIISVVFALLYAAYMLFGGIILKLSLDWKIAVYALFGVYLLLAVVLGIVSLTGGNDFNSKKFKKRSTALKFFRCIVKIASIAMAVAALALSTATGSVDAVSIALDTAAIIISIIFIVLQALPLLFGSIAGLARWVLSPPKIKLRFSFVVSEWYELLMRDSQASLATKKVSEKYIEDIGNCLDKYILPSLGKKRIKDVKVNAIYNLIDRVPEEDKSVTEGIMKNIYGYAVECGYVLIDICKDMGLKGSIEVEEKPKRESFKLRMGKRLGKKLIDKILNDSESELAFEEDEEEEPVKPEKKEKKSILKRKNKEKRETEEKEKVKEEKKVKNKRKGKKTENENSEAAVEEKDTSKKRKKK